MDLEYGIERVEIIYHDKPIIIEKDVDCIGDTIWSMNYKDTGVSFHELPTIKEAIMFACGVNSGILKYNPNIKGIEFE